MAVTIRPASREDLPAINRVVQAAIDTWELPQRVKRLSLNSYRYNSHDWEHLAFQVAEDAQIVGVASWETADAGDIPAEATTALLLHGLYVIPEFQERGIGSRLVDAALEASRSGNYDGLLVKAHSRAQRFFATAGFVLLPVTNASRDYPFRYWYPLRNR